MKLVQIFRSIALLLLLGLATQPALSQPQIPADVAERMTQQDWLTADIKLDNRPYAATRTAIDKRIRQGEKPANLERLFRLKGKEIYDAQKIFRWAYAAYRLQKTDPQDNLLSTVESAMNRNSQPGAYDWLRLRFLISSQRFFAARPTDELIKLGRRLLKVRYEDEEVMYYFVRDLQGSRKLPDHKLSLALARDEAQKRPKDAYWQWLVANAVTSVVGYKTGFASPKDNQWQIAEYEKALLLMPRSDPNRKRLLDSIIRMQMLYDANGKMQLITEEKVDEAMKNSPLR